MLRWISIQHLSLKRVARSKKQIIHFVRKKTIQEPTVPRDPSTSFSTYQSKVFWHENGNFLMRFCHTRTTKHADEKAGTGKTVSNVEPLEIKTHRFWKRSVSRVEALKNGYVSVICRPFQQKGCGWKRISVEKTKRKCECGQKYLVRFRWDKNITFHALSFSPPGFRAAIFLAFFLRHTGRTN